MNLAARLTHAAALRQPLAELDRAMRVVELRVSAGTAPRYHLTRVHIARAELQALLASAEADCAAARGELLAAVGPGGTRVAAIRAGAPRLDMEAPPDLPALEEALVTASERRPDLRALRARADALAAEIDVARRTAFPGIGLRLGAQFGQSPGQLDLGAGLVLPLPVVDRGHAAVSAASARRDAATLEAAAALAEAQARIRAAHEEAARRRDAWLAFHATAAERAADLRAEVEAGYRDARLTILELIDAYQTMRDLRLRDLELAAAARAAALALRRQVDVGG